MKFKPAISLASLSVCAASVVLYLSGCSSVPTPAVADGSSRVPANDPARVQSLQNRVAADRTLLTENNLLRAQVDVLQQKLTEMTAIVREALVLPPASPAKPAAPVASPVPAASAPSMQPQSAVDKLPCKASSAQCVPFYAYMTTPEGVVIRVFYRFGNSTFKPAEAVATALKEGLHGATRVEVRGYTDSNLDDWSNRYIALERARKARDWLIRNGVEAEKIHMVSFPSGNFLTENDTQQGRSLNRRVEIDIRNPQLNGSQVARNG